MPDSYMVTYKVNGASHMAGPYPQLDEAHYQADDIATFVGVTDVEVVPEHHIAEPLRAMRRQQKAFARDIESEAAEYSARTILEAEDARTPGSWRS